MRHTYEIIDFQNKPPMDQAIQAIKEPCFEQEKGLVHNWRNHLPSELQESWHRLAPETRMAIYLICENMADNEEWD